VKFTTDFISYYMISDFKMVLFDRVLKRRVIFRCTVNLTENSSSKEDCITIYTYKSTIHIRDFNGYIRRLFTNNGTPLEPYSKKI
jgi:hypothetical protein